MRSELDKIDEDEPIFVLRAQDQVAPQIVELYALNLTMLHVDPEKVRSARKVATDMRLWQMKNGCKVPD